MMSVQAMPAAGDAGDWRTGIGLSFEALHGMVTLVFFSGSQASFEGNPA
jgi:hypothetical protein